MQNGLAGDDDPSSHVVETHNRISKEEKEGTFEGSIWWPPAITRSAESLNESVCTVQGRAPCDCLLQVCQEVCSETLCNSRYSILSCKDLYICTSQHAKRVHVLLHFIPGTGFTKQMTCNLVDFQWGWCHQLSLFMFRRPRSFSTYSHMIEAASSRT